MSNITRIQSCQKDLSHERRELTETELATVTGAFGPGYGHSSEGWHGGGWHGGGWHGGGWHGGGWHGGGLCDYDD